VPPETHPSSAGWPSPVVPGFNPDPSIVAVDGVYYLITSTFEYLPGIPVYRSTDLIEWTQIGNVITRPEQAGLADVPTPGGVWAPTIRFRDGVFHVLVTVMLGGRGCVLFTATDPAGPWSDGLVIDAVDGIDPDLAWDENGACYITFARHPDAIQQVRVDLTTGRALEPVRALWSGSGRYSPEGPHLYRRGKWWYLVVAEGGTDRGHAVTVARSSRPEGPFESSPTNPVLTAAGTGSPVQNLGHGDLVELPDGGTAMVLLGVRPVGLAQAFSPLGRQTFLTAVRWDDDGWPHGDMVVLNPHTQPEIAVEFTDPAVLDDPRWLAVRRTPTEVAHIDEASGRLVITADGAGLGDRRPWFVGRRQRDLHATISVTVDASAGAGGVAARYAEDHYFAIEARGGAEGNAVTATAVLSKLERSWTVSLPPGEVELRIEMTPPPSGFAAGAVGGDVIRLFAGAGGQEVLLTELDGRYWCYETAKSFTGRVIGMYAGEGTVAFGCFVER
jgi:xylan 1,4-beta-xylosidase